MSVLECTRTALRALSANRLRALLTMLGIVIGVGAVITLMAVGRGAQATITQQIQSLGTNLLFVRPGSSQQGGIRQSQGSSTATTSAPAVSRRNSAPDSDSGEFRVSCGSRRSTSRSAPATKSVVGASPAATIEPWRPEPRRRPS